MYGNSEWILSFTVAFIAKVFGQACPPGSNVVRMCAQEEFTGQRVLLDTASNSMALNNCSCQFYASANVVKIGGYRTPNMPECNSAIRLHSTFGRNFRFQCQVGDTYLDTTVYKEGRITLEIYKELHDTNYCLLLETFERDLSSIKVKCTNDLTASVNGLDVVTVINSNIGYSPIDVGASAKSNQFLGIDRYMTTVRKVTTTKSYNSKSVVIDERAILETSEQIKPFLKSAYDESLQAFDISHDTSNMGNSINTKITHIRSIINKTNTDSLKNVKISDTTTENTAQSANIFTADNVNTEYAAKDVITSDRFNADISDTARTHKANVIRTVHANDKNTLNTTHNNYVNAVSPTITSYADTIDTPKTDNAIVEVTKPVYGITQRTNNRLDNIFNGRLTTRLTNKGETYDSTNLLNVDKGSLQLTITLNSTEGPLPSAFVTSFVSNIDKSKISPNKEDIFNNLFDDTHTTDDISLLNNTNTTSNRDMLLNLDLSNTHNRNEYISKSQDKVSKNPTQKSERTNSTIGIKNTGSPDLQNSYIFNRNNIFKNLKLTPKRKILLPEMDRSYTTNLNKSFRYPEKTLFRKTENTPKSSFDSQNVRNEENISVHPGTIFLNDSVKKFITSDDVSNAPSMKEKILNTSKTLLRSAFLNSLIANRNNNNNNSENIYPESTWKVTDREFRSVVNSSYVLNLTKSFAYPDKMSLNTPENKPNQAVEVIVDITKEAITTVSGVNDLHDFHVTIDSKKTSLNGTLNKYVTTYGNSHVTTNIKSLPNQVTIGSNKTTNTVRPEHGSLAVGNINEISSQPETSSWNSTEGTVNSLFNTTYVLNISPSLYTTNAYMQKEFKPSAEKTSYERPFLLEINDSVMKDSIIEHTDMTTSYDTKILIKPFNNAYTLDANMNSSLLPDKAWKAAENTLDVGFANRSNKNPKAIIKSKLTTPSFVTVTLYELVIESINNKTNKNADAFLHLLHEPQPSTSSMGKDMGLKNIKGQNISIVVNDTTLIKNIDKDILSLNADEKFIEKFHSENTKQETVTNKEIIHEISFQAATAATSTTLQPSIKQIVSETILRHTENTERLAEIKQSLESTTHSVAHQQQITSFESTPFDIIATRDARPGESLIPNKAAKTEATPGIADFMEVSVPDEISEGGPALNVSVDTKLDNASFNINNDVDTIIVVGVIVGLAVLATIVGIVCHTRRKRSEKINISGKIVDSTTHQNDAFVNNVGDADKGIKEEANTTEVNKDQPTNTYQNPVQTM